MLIVSLTLMSLIAFAANSILCRIAIGSGAIDATSFTILRLLSGAVTLALLARPININKHSHIRGSWLSGLMLFIYAAAFSFAYTLLDTGVGALVLFGTVQITVLLNAWRNKEVLKPSQYIGLIMAFGGLILLLLPIETLSGMTISNTGVFLMALSGFAWGIYTLLGRASDNPLHDTAYNFIKSLPFCACLVLVFLYQPAHWSVRGVLLAVAAGAVTSGLGYAIWYRVLPFLSSLQSGVVQLSVPVLAAFGGIIFLAETMSLTLSISLALVLTGVFMVLYAPSTNQPVRHS